LTLPGLEPQPLSRPARSQSLCRLRYPGSLIIQDDFLKLEPSFGNVNNDMYSVLEGYGYFGKTHMHSTVILVIENFIHSKVFTMHLVTTSL
jgi:hypothetical protein